MNRYETIASRLRRLRRLKSIQEDRDISQREVASSIGVSINSIGNWENGVTTMGVDDACRLAEYYGVPLDELVVREEHEIAR